MLQVATNYIDQRYLESRREPVGPPFGFKPVGTNQNAICFLSLDVAEKNARKNIFP